VMTAKLTRENHLIRLKRFGISAPKIGRLHAKKDASGTPTGSSGFCFSAETFIAHRHGHPSTIGDYERRCLLREPPA
jgi:hypothetical protein